MEYNANKEKFWTKRNRFDISHEHINDEHVNAWTEMLQSHTDMLLGWSGILNKNS